MLQGLESADVPFKFVEAGPAAKVEADHLERSFRRCAACMNQDQHARDNGAAGLNHHAILFRAQQMPTTQQLFEHAKEQLDHPAMSIRL
jgi:hypothetical protein